MATAAFYRGRWKAGVAFLASPETGLEAFATIFRRRGRRQKGISMLRFTAGLLAGLSGQATLGDVRVAFDDFRVVGLK